MCYIADLVMKKPGSALAMVVAIFGDPGKV
jgi:hypothetical protein